jgi:hypothetical protein
MVLDQLLPSILLHSFLEWTHTSFEQCVAEFYTVLLEEHLQVALEMSEVGICSSLVSKTDQSGSVMFKSGDGAGAGAREDVEVHLCAFKTMAELFQLCELGLSSWKTELFFRNNVWIMGCM